MLEPAVFPFANLELGQSAEFSVLLDAALVERFSQLSGDTNPLHMDEAYAATTPYAQRVVHGMLASSFFSKLVGMHLPGLHSVYLSQSLFFRQPIPIGTRVFVQGIIKQRIEAAQCIKLQTKILDQDKQVVFVDGEALVKVLH